MADSGLESYVLRPLRSRQFLIALAILIAVSMSIAYVASMPRGYERFMSLSTLGREMMASNYYPSTSPDVALGDDMRWYLQVYNRMGSAEYIAVRVKLLNADMPIPDDNMHTPSPVEHLYEVRQVVAHDSTITIPLEWSIASIARERGDDGRMYVVVKEVLINGERVSTDVRSIDGKNFRLVMELWRYNPESRAFEFSWLDSMNERRSVWNQIWFNVK
ncbi:MAG: hypothetical protein NZ888_04140 [Candidatus Nitrosocaldus sp.]|nr:hypothetical protein [Candidatus Nitrosocaldus sp.]MCS7141358.1 hypothetical protein [Candidatus Nitrosocaldus sp.]MDW8000987.1 hypothetical protein [Candidatus Nitrosocaldus sp.]